jgi:hypothetical protein
LLSVRFPRSADIAQLVHPADHRNEQASLLRNDPEHPRSEVGVPRPPGRRTTETATADCSAVSRLREFQ